MDLCPVKDTHLCPLSLFNSFAFIGRMYQTLFLNKIAASVWVHLYPTEKTITMFY